MELTRKITKTNTVFMAAIVFAAGGLAAANCSADAKMKKPRTQPPTRHSRAGLVRPAERRIKKPKGFSFLNAL